MGAAEKCNSLRRRSGVRNSKKGISWTASLPDKIRVSRSDRRTRTCMRIEWALIKRRQPLPSVAAQKSRARWDAHIGYLRIQRRECRIQYNSSKARDSAKTQETLVRTAPRALA